MLLTSRQNQAPRHNAQGCIADESMVTCANLIHAGFQPSSRPREQKRLPLNHLGSRIELIIAFILRLILALITGVGTLSSNNRIRGGPRLGSPCSK